jgi:PKD repeat protein
MRSMPLMAVSTVMLAAAWACGGDGGNVEPNTPPVAAFTAPSCTAGTPCSFTDASTDADGTIASRSWDFGDPSSGAANASQNANSTHTFATAGTYNVKLTVTDNGGATDDQTNAVTVTGSGNQLPVASFDTPSCTVNAACAFHSTSTDPDGTIVSAHWDFGDGASLDGVDVTHTYTTAGPFIVTLTVTDNLGGTATADQTITVAPPSAQDCTTNLTLVTCSLTVPSRSTVAVNLTSTDCELLGNKVMVNQPRRQTAYFNVCNKTTGTYTVLDATGAPAVFEAGAVLQIEFTQGVADPDDPPVGLPAGEIGGTPGNWTINIDDGGNPTGAGEPDFIDVVLAVQTTPA